MSDRRAASRRLALACAALMSAVFAAGAVTGRVYEARLSARGLDHQSGDLPTLIAFTTFLVVGVVLMVKLPRNPIGWILAFVPTMGSLSFAAPNYAAWGQAGADLPGERVALWFSGWTWLATITPLPVLLLLFPTGAPAGRRWRWLLWLSLAAPVLATSAAAFVPGPMDAPGDPLNPFGIPGTGALFGAAFVTASIGLLCSALGGVASLLLRFKQARGEEKAQLKWFAYAATIAVCVTIAGDLFLDRLLGSRAEDYLFGLSLALIPLSIAVAVLRYRLYDVDVIINRTLVYLGLSGVLVAVYAASVVVLQQALAPFTAESDLGVAASTLTVAALFGPARRRVQSFIDRRFYRSRYDAVRALERFRARLRDEVELDAITAEALALVHGTLHPAHAGIVLTGTDR